MMASETEKTHTLLQSCSTESLISSLGLGIFCLVADRLLQFSIIQQNDWVRALSDNAVHCVIGMWSWAIVIGVKKKTDFGEIVLAGFLASVIDVDHFLLAGSLSLQVRSIYVKFLRSFPSFLWHHFIDLHSVILVRARDLPYFKIRKLIHPTFSSGWYLPEDTYRYVANQVIWHHKVHGCAHEDSLIASEALRAGFTKDVFNQVLKEGLANWFRVIGGHSRGCPSFYISVLSSGLHLKFPLIHMFNS